ncbi:MULTISPECIES: ATP-binding protein [Xanthomonas translucens group]|uniref:ATP-binding protein n=1 Tax=Xanthomonas translucens group TaxID=3390202 RepID=UPI0009BE83DF|nr:ATP-binding protein [Xanthomonas translucens]WLA00687.1 AAA family ATPase [Xanthomonas translucens]
MKMVEGSVEADFVLRRLSDGLGNVLPEYTIKSRPDGEVLNVIFAKPNERVNQVLASVMDGLGEDHSFYGHVTIQPREKKPANVVNIPEARMLQRELSESLTVDRNTFGDEFLVRYIQSVTDHEVNVVGNANFIVYGRRGSGKSSLLAYAMHSARGKRQHFSWIALQTYNGRSDLYAICSVLENILRELFDSSGVVGLDAIATELAEISDGESDSFISSRLNRIIPRARSLISSISRRESPVTIFLDDLHVLHHALQPKLLGVLYSMTRGNNSYIKLSGIEQYTNSWDGTAKVGLEPPHDAQILKLDHNLTMPDRSRNHIVSILDAHARYCALPGIDYLAEQSVLSRLVLIAAAVPRDALSLFSQAITKSLVKGQKAVTITALNAAASEAVEEKMKDVGRDSAREDEAEMRAMLERLKDFCVRQVRTNAFLVRIDSTSREFNLIQRLIALRFVHVLHEGITPNKVAERYVALMLDFGFYIGVRAARSIQLFPEEPRMLAAKELRKLPIFSSSSDEADSGKSSEKVRKGVKNVSKNPRPVSKAKPASAKVVKKKAVVTKATVRKVSKKAVASKGLKKNIALKKTTKKNPLRVSVSKRAAVGSNKKPNKSSRTK